MITRDQIESLVRHGLTITAGILVAKGFIDESIVPEIIGLGLTIVAIVWSFKSKTKS
jgi:hypothetical protein